MLPAFRDRRLSRLCLQRLLQARLVVRRLEDAGAILIGKTNMDQFANRIGRDALPFGACSSVF